MATAPATETKAATTPATTQGVDRWVCIPATWDVYRGLLEARGERSRPKYTFVDGRLTVVSPGHSHESIKTRLAALIDMIFLQLSVDFHASGEVTLLKSRNSREGTEPDASYYLADIHRVVGKKELVMGEDAPPDLVVEVVVSHHEHDALESYRRFGVREVWVCKDGGLAFHVLGPDGRYAPSPSSSLLPVLAAEELAPWVYRQDLAGENRVRNEFRAWVAETLAPRRRPDA